MGHADTWESVSVASYSASGPTEPARLLLMLFKHKYHRNLQPNDCGAFKHY